MHAAGVPVVVCWSTLAENTAARIFAMTFFKTYMRGKDYRQASSVLARGARCTVHGAWCTVHAWRDATLLRAQGPTPVPSRGQPQRESHPEQAFDEARRGVLLTTRIGTRWDQEPLHASPSRRGDDAPCEVPKYALVDPLGANVVHGRVVDAGFSPEPYAAGVAAPQLELYISLYVPAYLPVSHHISPYLPTSPRCRCCCTRRIARST